MKKPIISIVGSGKNVRLWKQLHDCLSSSVVDFEIILTGDVRPRFKLPSNFKYIYSETKPVQCAEISARNAVGEYIMEIVDDLYFSPRYLDNLLEFYKENCTDKDCASGLFERSGLMYSIEDYQFWSGVKGSPALPFCSFCKTSLWRSLGGADKRFIGVFWVQDVHLRLFENGGKNYVCKDCISEEIYMPKFESRFTFYLNKILNKLKYLLFGIRIGDGLYQEFGIPHDRPLLDSLWTKPTKDLLSNEKFYASKDGYTHLVKRKTVVEPFDNKDILNLSQGNKGRWK
jgi:hypothetical protein